MAKTTEATRKQSLFISNSADAIPPTRSNSHSFINDPQGVLKATSILSGLHIPHQIEPYFGGGAKGRVTLQLLARESKTNDIWSIRYLLDRSQSQYLAFVRRRAFYGHIMSYVQVVGMFSAGEN